MFNFFSILLLLTAVLQIVEAIQIGVKPSNLRYKAEISCLQRKRSITIGTAKHESAFFGARVATGCVDIRTDLSRCDDHHNSTVKVLITNLDRPSDSMEFEIPKAELSARRSAVVLAFNIEPRAYKQFYFQHSSTNFGVSQRPLVDYELQIECKYRHADGALTHYLIGSGIQFNGQNGINMPIYEIEMLAFCEEDRIGLAIHNAEHETTTFINVTREFLLQNDAFNINMSNETVQPIHNDALLLLAAALHIVEAIKIWVKPSNLRYKAEISCLRHNLRITIGQATHALSFGEYGTAGYVNIRTVLSRCDDSTVKSWGWRKGTVLNGEGTEPFGERGVSRKPGPVKVRITNLDDPSDSSIFEIPKAGLSARRSAVVLAFNIEPRTYKQFYFQQSPTNFGVSQRPLVDYELQIECKYRHADGTKQYYLIGSGIQFNGQNGINMPIYEIERLAFCEEGKIGLAIQKNAENETTYINVTKQFFLQNGAFKINMSNKTVQPIHNDALKMVEEIEPKMKTIEYGTAGYVDIDTDLSRCDDHHNSTVKVLITNLDRPSDSAQFEIPKAELSARRSAVVLGFNILPSAPKQFYFNNRPQILGKCDQRNSTVKVLITNLDRPSDSMEFEIPKAELSARKSAVVLAFNIEPRAYKIFYFQQSSSIFRYFQQSPLEKLAFCSQGRIGLNIYNAEHETTHINLTKEFFLENDAFKINMRNKTVQPILQNGRGN
uniref:Uncharacterized protein n=1 Tax=Globodera rostochiensis TaxID=31243 RepID=A0A914IBI2_GLORO